jgi:hypothetical protein
VEDITESFGRGGQAAIAQFVNTHTRDNPDVAAGSRERDSQQSLTTGQRERP